MVEEIVFVKFGVFGIKYIVVVVLGKGGVGKFIIMVNLVLGMVVNGLKVGVFDVDIYGLFVLWFFNVFGCLEVLFGCMLKLLEGYGVKVMFMGFMVEEEILMIWCGLMVIFVLI